MRKCRGVRHSVDRRAPAHVHWGASLPTHSWGWQLSDCLHGCIMSYLEQGYALNLIEVCHAHHNDYVLWREASE